MIVYHIVPFVYYLLLNDRTTLYYSMTGLASTTTRWPVDLKSFCRQLYNRKQTFARKKILNDMIYNESGVIVYWLKILQLLKELLSRNISEMQFNLHLENKIPWILYVIIFLYSYELGDG